MKMKKLWMALFVCLLMCSLLSVGALAEDMQAEDAQAMPAANSEEGLTGSGTSSDPFLVNQDSLAALAAYFDANEANPPEETIYLKGDGDIQLPEGIHITLPEGFIINLDFNGYRLSKSDMADSAPIENYAILTIEDSSEGQKGGIDGKNRCINNHAVATINGGFYTTNSDIGGGGTAIRNADADSEMTINDCEVKASNFAVFNNGTMTVNGGDFVSTACAHRSDWAYCFSSEGTLYFKDGNVTGVQGALSIANGYAEVYDGNFKTVQCEQSETGCTSHYGIYIAGEEGEVEAYVYGGTFESAEQVAILCGNDNTGGDGGINAKATATISGGKFTGAPGFDAMRAGKNTGDPHIIGGDFSSNVSDYVDPAYVCQEKDGRFVVLPRTAENAVARIDDAYYETLEQTIGEVTEGQTITLLGDISLASPINLIEKNFVLDLGDATLSNPAGTVFNIMDSTVEIKNGTVKTTNLLWAPAITADTGTKLTIAKDAVVSGTYGIGVNQVLSAEKSTAGKDTVIDIYGTVTGVNDDKVLDVGGTPALSINGNLNSTTDFATIHLHEGAVLTGYQGRSGNINNDDAPAIYAAGYGRWIFEDGVTVSGSEAIGIKSGQFEIQGGDFIANGTYVDPATSWGNGTEATGACLSVTYNKVYAGQVEINIDGGTFSSENGYAFYESDTQTQIGSALKENGLSFADASFKGQAGAVYSKHGEAFIASGYFSSDPGDYIMADKVVKNSDKQGYAYMVAEKTEGEVIVKPAIKEPEVTSTIEDPTAKAAAEAAAKTVDAPDIVDAANQAAQQMDDATKDAAVEQAKTELNLDETEEVIVYTQVYLKIEPKVYDAAEKTLVMNIEPVYQLVASIATRADDIKLTGVAGERNAVEYGEETSLTITEPMKVTVTLPEGFAAGEKIYIEHQAAAGTYYYRATVGADRQITFTSYHGFSPFTFSTNNKAVAEVGEIGYATLTEALAAVEDGGVVTVLQDGLSGEVKGNKTFTVVKAPGVTAEPDIKAASGYRLSQGENGQYTVRKISGGSSSSTSYYTITKPSQVEYGTITVSNTRAKTNDTITITVTPETGYELDTLTVMDENNQKVTLTEKGDGTYTFRMPAADVTIKVAFAKVGESSAQLPFADVNASDWYYEAVQYVYEQGMMNGTTATAFSPNLTTTRGMIVTILYRLENQPDAGEMTFTDVAANQYYTNAIAWAAANEIVNGYGDNTFGPNDTITREQMAAILYRYAQHKGYDTTQGGMQIREFADYDEISAYAVTPMTWAVNAGLLSGITEQMLEPAGNATRAQVAMILMRFCENIIK